MGSRKRLSKNKPLKWANTEVWCQGKKIDTKGLVYRQGMIEPEPREKKQTPQGNSQFIFFDGFMKKLPGQ